MLAIAVVVRNASGDILLRKRQNDPDKGSWEIFAGYPYSDELPLGKAVARILREKAGITEFSDLKSTGKFYDTPDRHMGNVCVPIVFTVIAESFTNENAQWFKRDEIEGLPMAFDNRGMINDVLSK